MVTQNSKFSLSSWTPGWKHSKDSQTSASRNSVPPGEGPTDLYYKHPTGAISRAGKHCFNILEIVNC